MRKLLLTATAGALLATAFASGAQASHRCHTLGHYQVCTFIPGDEILDDILR